MSYPFQRRPEDRLSFGSNTNFMSTGGTENIETDTPKPKHQFDDVFTPCSANSPNTLQLSSSHRHPGAFASSPYYLQYLLGAGVTSANAENVTPSTASVPFGALKDSVTSPLLTGSVTRKRPVSSPIIETTNPITKEGESAHQEQDINKVVEAAICTVVDEAAAAEWPCEPGVTFHCPFQYYEELLAHAERHGFTIARSFERYSSSNQAKYKVIVKKGYIYCNVMKSRRGRRGCCFSIRFVHTKLGHYRVNKCNTGHLHPLCCEEAGGRRRKPVNKKVATAEK